MRQDRELAARAIGDDPLHYARLLECAHSKDPGLRKKACWVLEIILLQHPYLLHRQKKLFFSLLGKLTQGSAIRPMAKIIATWCTERFGTQPTAYPTLSVSERSKLAEHCFSWLLDDLPTAVKVYSMEALFQLGKDIAWIHPDLKAHLLKTFPKASPGYQARAKKLLGKL